MSQYGKILDPDFNMDRENLYPIFSNYFENPRLVKLKDVDKYSLYIVKINCYLNLEQRYLMLFIYKDDKPQGYIETMSKLKWICLQTRTLKEEYNVHTHTYLPRRLKNIDLPIQITSKNDKCYEYNVKDLPVKISLLLKDKDTYYSDTGNIVSALETYETIVTFY